MEAGGVTLWECGVREAWVQRGLDWEWSRVEEGGEGGATEAASEWEVDRRAWPGQRLRWGEGERMLRTTAGPEVVGRRALTKRPKAILKLQRAFAVSARRRAHTQSTNRPTITPVPR